MAGAAEQDHIGQSQRLAAVLQVATMVAEDPAVLSATLLVSPSALGQETAHKRAIPAIGRSGPPSRWLDAARVNRL
jgi:hypothetical protein